MKIELSEEQLGNMLALLNRVDIKGGEAMVVAVLLQKFQQALEAAKQASPKNDESSKEKR